MVHLTVVMILSGMGRLKEISLAEALLMEPVVMDISLDNLLWQSLKMLGYQKKQN